MKKDQDPLLPFGSLLGPNPPKNFTYTLSVCALGREEKSGPSTSLRSLSNSLTVFRPATAQSHKCCILQLLTSDWISLMSWLSPVLIKTKYTQFPSIWRFVNFCPQPPHPASPSPVTASSGVLKFKKKRKIIEWIQIKQFSLDVKTSKHFLAVLGFPRNLLQLFKSPKLF